MEQTKSIKNIKVTMSFIGFINSLFDFINKMEESGVELPRSITVADVKAEIVLARLKSIADRALEINDSKIIGDLMSLGIINEVAEKPLEFSEVKG